MDSQYLKVHRHGFTRSNGTKVRGSTFEIQDRGLRGRGPETFGELKEGGLGGWHGDQSKETRRAHLREVAKRDGWHTVYHRLDALSKLNYRVNRELSRKARSDANFARSHL
ncbi:MAG: hypothetical protein KGN01_06495 [Patescibacteria group bacterium]|nr:hypothetical protein [Patescibacteria group bacterium]